MRHLRNFCIIAHVDHGKSTLADRLLESTATVQASQMQDQLLDDMELERERGITIKSRAVQMHYHHGGKAYTLNLIDTPGHVDFSYEVSRALAACNGVLLVVDAAQGIEAQTIANLYLAIEQGLAIIPVLNKVDLPSARVEATAQELVELLGCAPEEVILASAKEGRGIEAILEAVVQRIPPPQGDITAPLQAMVFDANYNPFRGVEVYLRIFNGTLKPEDTLRFLQTSQTYRADEIGVLGLQKRPQPKLQAGDVGYLLASIKSAGHVKIGDTLTHASRPCQEAVKGFAEAKPMLFAGLYPVVASEYEALRLALEKLQLNDAALTWEPETSVALGFGFRCGYLGMLHMDIVQERLTREFGMDVLATAPSVRFKVTNKQGHEKDVHAPSQMPPPGEIAMIAEPTVQAHIITKQAFLGKVMELAINEHRGVLNSQAHLTKDRVEVTFTLPLAEIAFDFFDKLKRVSKGYASLDYELLGFEPSNLVRLDILLNGEKVDALSIIVHRDKAYRWGKQLCAKLKELLPRHLFEVPIQAAIGAKVIARETVKAKRKDVTAKCYGGDISRKRKLLEKQKKGKKRMRQIGSIEVPQAAFLAILKVE